MAGCRRALGWRRPPAALSIASTSALVVMAILGALLGSDGAPAQEAVDLSPIAPATVAPAGAGGGPEILRGSVAPPAPQIEPAAGPADRQLLAGERLWVVDEESRRLIGCRLVQTIYVDGLAIQCRERRLPRGAVAHR